MKVRKKTTSEKNNDSYSKHLRQKAELLLRLYMGLQQIKYHPYYYLTFLPVLLTFGIVWCNKNQIFTIPFLPLKLLALFNIVISMLLIITLVLFLIVLIKHFGIWASKSIEHDLITVFDAKDLNRWGYPILISFKHIKGTYTFVIELYSDILLSRWLAKKSDIEDIMGIDILSIENVEKNRRNRKVIIAKLKGIENTKLHDDKLDEELENVD